MNKELGKSLGYQLADGSWSSQYKIGEKFIVGDEEGTFCKGSIVEFLRDDCSSCPVFALIDGSQNIYYSKEEAIDGLYEHWSNLSPYKEN